MRSSYAFPKSYVSRLADTARRAGTYNWNKEIDAHLPDGRARCGNQVLTMLAGYSYLGLIRRDELRQAAQYALDEFGLGTHGTRPNCGTTRLHNKLETTISMTNGTEATCLFPSGYQANLSSISALVDEHDVVIGDELNHASIVDGCRLSGAKLLTYKHKNLDDLRVKLVGTQGFRTRLVITDAVFSMDGDIADIPKICQLCEDHRAILLVDEAHSFGVLGRTGRGIIEHFGLGASDVDIITGVLSKTIPGTGGYASGSHALVDYLRHNARSYIFSAALAPFSVAVATAAIDLMRKEPQMIATLWNNTKLFHDELRRLDLDIGETETPITPVIIPDAKQCLRAANACMRDGVYLVAVPFPLVPFGRSRLRATVTAEHLEGDLIEAAKIIKRAAALAKEGSRNHPHTPPELDPMHRTTV